MIVSVVNAVSNQVNTTTTTRTLNVLDGVVLTEAIRYATLKTRNYLGISVSYMVMDIEEHSPLYTAHFKPRLR